MSDSSPPAAQFDVLDRHERRVFGVLIEKAKTTPDAYPLSLNALRNGCNQKSNRFPQMTLDEEQVDRAADSLRQKKAVSLVQGDSRVERFRHLGYDWFGVDKVELAVLAELLMRGAQTVGELRARAARMEAIKGMTELNPVLDSLVNKGHVVYLSPPGRGAIVSHTFYTESEMDRVRRDLGLGAAPQGDSTMRQESARVEPVEQSEVLLPPAVSNADDSNEIAKLREEVAKLRQEFEALRDQLGG